MPWRRRSRPPQRGPRRRRVDTNVRAVGSKLKRGESGTNGARRITRRRIKSALRILGPNQTDDGSIHAARKDLKRARATLRLLRGALGKATYKKENVALRDAARPLSEARDGRVLLDALDSLLKHYGAPAANLPLDGFRRALSRRRAQVRKRVLGKRGPLRHVGNTLRKVLSRSDDWDVGRRGWSVLGPGLKRTYKKGREAFSRARARPTNESLHEWRKQTKYFWHQLQLFEPLGPGSQVAEAADLAHKVEDFLGDDHDLAILSERAEEAHDAFRDAAGRKALLTLIERRRAGLQQKALQLGLRLYEEPPADFTARIEKCWREWRAG
jgi:CHAD domain-containing protein